MVVSSVTVGRGYLRICGNFKRLRTHAMHIQYDARRIFIVIYQKMKHFGSACFVMFVGI